ncbi:MAG: hypothetical protein HC862_12905 [Scytonema sp. RU_4_4]|nr:hypothetical protein [Scytonema sp. RU_4_4]
MTIKALLDENKYQKSIKISDKELSSVRLEKSEFHGDWNYRIVPQNDLNLSSPSANR